MHHENEVSYGGTIDRSPGAGPHNTGDLGNDAAGPHIAVKDFAVSGEGIHAFLNARAPRIVQTDNRVANSHRQIHHFTDLLSVRFSQGTSDDGKILAENKNFAAVDGAVAGNNPVARDSSWLSPMASPRPTLSISNSSKLPSSRRRSIRSRAVSLPLRCWASLFVLSSGSYGLGAKFLQGFKSCIVLSIHSVHLYSKKSAPGKEGGKGVFTAFILSYLPRCVFWKDPRHAFFESNPVKGIHIAEQRCNSCNGASVNISTYMNSSIPEFSNRHDSRRHLVPHAFPHFWPSSSSCLGIGFFLSTLRAGGHLLFAH